MKYRNYYWKEVKRLLEVAMTMMWYGVVLNKGHHSHWRKK